MLKYINQGRYDQSKDPTLTRLKTDQIGAQPEIDLCQETQVQPFLQIVMMTTAGKMIITKALSRSQDKITKRVE